MYTYSYDYFTSKQWGVTNTLVHYFSKSHSVLITGRKLKAHVKFLNTKSKQYYVSDW